MGRPEEIASVVLRLCSGLDGFTVGHALVVNGGQTVGGSSSPSERLTSTRSDGCTAGEP